MFYETRILTRCRRVFGGQGKNRRDVSKGKKGKSVVLQIAAYEEGGRGDLLKESISRKLFVAWSRSHPGKWLED